MTYAMIIMESDEDAVETRSTAERDFDALVRWFARLRADGTLIASARLAPVQTTTHVSWRGREPMVTDGPYMEAKESVAGFLLLDVATEAEALEVVRSLPAKLGTRIELRRVRQPPSRMEP